MAVTTRLKYKAGLHQEDHKERTRTSDFENNNGNQKENLSNYNSPNKRINPMVYVVFTSLLLDLLAFTMILPLFPSLLDYYKKNDGPSGLYSTLEDKVDKFQHLVGAPFQFKSVLFGGFLGSLFSFLQFVTSPIVGGLSDVYGRKPILLICLVGIMVSYFLWSISYDFTIFVLARIVGGISKGNVSLSMAIVTDLSSVSNRGAGMALVGIAFSVGFIVGPLIGAMFARWAQMQTGLWFVYPALVALLLSFANVVFVSLFYKESLPKGKRCKSLASSVSQALAFIKVNDLFQFTAVQNLSKSDLFELRHLGLVYFVYLFLYSGLEFTLTFLTHHKFHYTSMQQGYMFFGIGLTMALLQGSWVRRIPINAARKTVSAGLLIIIPSFLCIGLAETIPVLYFGVFLFAVSTSMVVPCMMTLASQYGTAAQKGTVMGIFRSLGALARAVGPIFASIAYWSIGSKITYCLGAVALLWPWISIRKTVKSPEKTS
nr:PREDICTED: major facilitator superfamily domain-containing protein 10 [Bemisia tabaci]